MLDIQQLSFGFAHQPRLVQSLSTQVKPGEMGLIQGPSGCGKSTLLSLIAGTQHDTITYTGQIMLNQLLLNDRPPHLRQVGLMFQEPLLFGHMSVADNLGFGLPAGLTKQVRRDRIQRALDTAEMSDMGARDPATLSGGQKARIALMRCLLAEPACLLLDESFSSLDPALRQSFGQFVHHHIRASNIPALLVSHDLADETLANGPIITL